MRISRYILAGLLAAIPFLKLQAQQESFLMEDHFYENSNGWNLGNDADVIRKIENGKLIMECQKNLSGGGGYWLKTPDFKLPATDYSISVTTTWISNSLTDNRYSPYGLIIGDYYFLLYADGNRRLLKYNTTEKKYETIVDWGESSALFKRDYGDNKIEIQYSGGKAGFYANGQMLYKKDAFIPEDAYVKLYVENSEVIAFDDLIVKSITPAKSQTTSKYSSDALVFNDKLIDITDSLYAMGTDWGDELTYSMEEGSYTYLQTKRINMEQYIDAQIIYLTNLKDVKGSEEFRNSIIQLLYFEKELITKAFLPFEKLTDASTKAEQDRLLNNLSEASKDEANFMKTMQSAQQVYADKNGFKLEPLDSDK